MGSVPSEFGHLSRLEFVSLNNNELVGVLPRELGLLTNLRKLFCWIGYGIFARSMDAIELILAFRVHTLSTCFQGP